MTWTAWVVGRIIDGYIDLEGFVGSEMGQGGGTT